MTAAIITLCKCGHAERRHSDEYGCENDECGCSAFRPDDGKTAPVRVVPPPGPAAASQPPRGAAAASPPTGAPSIEQLLAAGKRSPSKRIAALAARVDGQVQALAGALHDERQAAETKRRADVEKEAARREVADLEQRLAAAKAKARRTPPATRVPGTGVCPDCGKTGLSNIGTHRFRAHGIKAG